MAVQPLNKTKIIKKITKHANRFQSDKYMRVGVSHFAAPLLSFALGLLEKAPWYRQQNQT